MEENIIPETVISDEITQWLTDNEKNYPSKRQLWKAGGEKFGRSDKSIAHIYYSKGKTRNRYQTKKELLGGLNEDQLRAKFDLNFIIDEAAKKLQKGFFVPESDFVTMNNFRHIPGYKTVMDREKYKVYKGRAGSTIYWSHPESIQKMKNDHILH